MTFDTGGISLKPGEKMDEMKFDKCGGCTVLGIMRAAADMGLPLNIVGVIPSVENMPGGGSYRPGDIVKLYGGKTAEILNTDAEGRLILADALSYVEERFSPRCIIDFATLTGACIVALGCNVAGMVSDSDDMAASVSLSADRTAEGVWRLPLDEDYMDMIKSKVADIKNLGTGRAAGTIAAAAFLKSAIKGTPWLHLDIAGTAWMQPALKEEAVQPAGRHWIWGPADSGLSGPYRIGAVAGLTVYDQAVCTQGNTRPVPLSGATPRMEWTGTPPGRSLGDRARARLATPPIKPQQ